MPIIITPMTHADIPGAIDTIQQAFASDPYNLWIYNDRSKLSLPRNRVSLGLRCAWGIANGMFYVAKDTEAQDPNRVLGTAMWIRPKPVSTTQGWAGWLDLGEWREWGWGWWLWVQQGWMNLVYGRGGLNVKRYYIWKKAQAELQSQIWTDPKGYYFCNIVTVLPSEQGRGIGKLLFKTVTDRADREGMRCYLESSKAEPNVAIYQKMGFHMVREMECDDDGAICRLFCMIREPQSPPPAGEQVTITEP